MHIAHFATRSAQSTPRGLQTNNGPDRGAVMSKAVIRTADRLGLSGKQLAPVIGLSEAQISRLKNGKYTLDGESKSFELAALLVRVFRSLDTITGSDEPANQAWLRNHNTALAARPIDKIQSITGLLDVLAYLDARRAPL